MGLLDVLNQYSRQGQPPPPHVVDDFHRVAQEAPEEELSAGLEHAFMSDDTPPFEDMVSQLYERADEPTRAGLLNEILGSLGGAAAGGALGGGILGGLLRDRAGRGGITPADARNVPVSDVREATAEAARRNPGALQQVSRYFARHPQIVSVLGQAALSVLMSGMARRRRG